jgi:anthranilate synthase component 2
MEKILVIDNYDSFTYNLVHYLQDLDCDVTVKRNDKLSLEDVDAFDKILLSPGPGIPDEAGLLKPIIERYGPSKSILGICLGQQAIAEVYGGRIQNLDTVYHGVATSIKRVNEDEVLYQGLPRELEVGRYHSWVVSKEIPEILEITAVDEQGEIMSLRHREFDVRAVQYHPESILTPHGKQLLKNWIKAGAL